MDDNLYQVIIILIATEAFLIMNYLTKWKERFIPILNKLSKTNSIEREVMILFDKHPEFNLTVEEKGRSSAVKEIKRARDGAIVRLGLMMSSRCRDSCNSEFHILRRVNICKY